MIAFRARTRPDLLNIGPDFLGPEFDFVEARRRILERSDALGAEGCDLQA